MKPQPVRDNVPWWLLAVVYIMLGVACYLAGYYAGKAVEPPGWEADVQTEDGRPKSIRFRPLKE